MTESTRPPLLLVEDDDDLREALEDTLSRVGYQVIAVGCAEDALAEIDRQAFGIVISDVQMPGMDGHALLDKIKARDRSLPVLLMTAYGQIDKAVAAMRAGACGYLPKPFTPDRLAEEIARHFRVPERDEAAPVAASAAFNQALEMARRVAQTDVSVLLTGESGVGKEVVARQIHLASLRVKGPWVAVNCAAIPENLMEAMFFGHEKGAYTGATAAQAGKFEQAHKGSIFLDEIGEMPLALQSKLLRVLQEREVERVGGKQPVKVDVRIITATNRDLAKEVKEGRFREDLYYRLNVFPIRLPALRERVDDILPLATRMMDRYAGQTGFGNKRLSPEAAASLCAHAWPGNVRELENVIQRAMILAMDIIQPEHLFLPTAAPAIAAPAPPPTPTPPTPPTPTPATAEPELAAPADEPGTTNLRALHREHLLSVLDSVQGNRVEAAKRLGISERTLRYHLQKLREAGTQIA